jgi:radical SAM superfamily enzyme YgiQ (UPF0313 family)
MENSILHKTRKRSVVPLTLPYLAALTPPEWDIQLVDEQLTDLDFESRADLVALTVWTLNSFRAYDIADRFRKRGIPVIMGGPHTFFHTEEVLEHCNAVAIGEGETIWPQMLRDAAAGRLERIYRSEYLSDLQNLPVPKYELLDFRRFSVFKTFTVQTSRGCPFRCDFCSERYYLGDRYRFRPVRDVVEEIRKSEARQLLFADSNFGGHIGHAMEIMEALIPLRLRWSALFPISICHNKAFLDLAQRSGLLHVNVGFESVSFEVLEQMNKKMNKAIPHGDVLADMNKRGISYSLNFIFGNDSEQEDIFRSTLAFLNRNHVPVAYFNLLTPHRGSPLYEKMSAENRIINDFYIGRWPGNTCHIRPRSGNPQDLENKVRKMYADFYNLSSMIKRLPFPRSVGDLASWYINLKQMKMQFRDRENFDEI